MFDGLSPKVEELLNAAKSDLPAAQVDAGLIDSMTLALSVDAAAPVVAHRNGSLVGKALTAKTAAMASVLLLSCGVASAATGVLPASAQNAASTAAEHVGLHIPKSDNHESDDDNGDDTSTTVEHPDNHGNDVSTVAHDDSTEGADHGTAVCTVASDGKCQPGSDDNSGQGNSADHRKDGDHPTTTTTVNDDNGGSDNSGNSGSDHPTQDSNPGDSHHGSND